MAERTQVYKCLICGQTIEVLTGGAGVLVCCNQPMKLMKDNTSDGATEKHVPVVEDNGKGGCRVKVGSVAHPMTPEHFIEWIEVINGNYVNRKYLKPGDAPEAEFYVPYRPGLVVREFCNLHGLWKKDV